LPYAQHRFSQIRIELVENRSPSPGGCRYDAFNHAANRIAFVANLFDQRHHLFRRYSIRAANNILLDLLPLYGGTIDFRNDFVNLRDVGDNLEFAYSTDNIFLAIAPAATRPIVSRAEARPPPCQFRIPYLAS